MGVGIGAWQCSGAASYNIIFETHIRWSLVSAAGKTLADFPEVLKQWHPTKNGDIESVEIKAGSGKKYWWECTECGNEWLANVGNRTRLGAGCPVCSEKKRSESSKRPEKGKSLLDEFPELCKEWHPEKNGDKTPDEYHPGSNRMVWWKCPEGPDHEWRTVVSSRSSGSRTGCPCCSRPARQLSVTNCLGSLYPGVAEQWHPTKNGDLTPDDVIANTPRKVWWQCLNNPEHEWQAQCGSVVRAWNSGTSGCPGCSQKMVSSTHNLAVVYPELAKEWHPTKNNNLLPEDVLPRSTEKCWWKCIYCGSEWAARPHERKGRRGKPGCPTCASIEARKAIGKARSTPKPGRSLQELHPLLAKRWHPTKNKGIKPIEVNEKSHRKVWWKCPEGDDHEWEAGCASVVVAWKTVSRGCPYCSGKRASSTNSLAVIFPEIAEEWHPTKNGKLTPDKITPGSNKIVWWECQKSHIWEAKISNRTSTNKTGCPYCAVSSSKVDSTNNLAVLHPELVKAWHPKNKRKPEEFRPGSNRKVWWICNKGPDHEWKAVIASRVQGYGCPCCSGHKLSVTNSLATKSPELVKEWHPTKNGKLTPGDVIAGAHRVVWWQCPEGPDHEWRISPGKRTSSDARTGRAVGTGCPACHGRQLSVTNNFALLYPELVPYWHPENNGELKPDQIVFGSPKRRWWKCPEGPDHEWRTTTTSLINSLKESGNYGCPFCSGLKVSVTNSLANHPESKIYWHPAKNGKITPADIVAGTNKKYWWKCPEGPDHEWKAASSGVVNSWKSGNSGCPCCKGLKWSVTNSLLINYPEAATHWHPTKNKDRKLEMVISGSDKRYWWKCQEGPDHEWNSNPRSKIMLQTGCPFCSGKRLSVTNSLATKYPEIAKEWHPTKNGDLTPENILAGSHKRVWWMCSNNPEHEWETIVDKRTGPEGTECPECLLKGTSKKEIRLAFELYKIFGLDYISKPRIKIGKRVFRPDILIEEHKLVVEYDGRWYHEDRAFDYEKTGALQEVGWNVIRVREIPLEKITENDVSVHHQEANKSVASRVLQQIEKVCDIKIPELADYLKLDRSINKRAADEYIAGLLRDAQQTTL